MLWKKYLQTKFLNLSKSLVNCHEALNIMNQCEDIQPDTLISYVIFIKFKQTLIIL